MHPNRVEEQALARGDGQFRPLRPGVGLDGVTAAQFHGREGTDRALDHAILSSDPQGDWLSFRPGIGSRHSVPRNTSRSKPDQTPLSWSGYLVTKSFLAFLPFSVVRAEPLTSYERGNAMGMEAAGG